MLIGIDLGGTKIEGVVLNEAGKTLCRERVDTPKDDYNLLLQSIQNLIQSLQQQTGFSDHEPIGFGTPGALNKNGLIKNSNSVCLNGQPLLLDLEKLLNRSVRIENDANCFALSESIQGAGKNARTVFGVIVGTGTGGGVVVNKKLLSGANHIGGEWGHNHMPGIGSLFADEKRSCYCGKRNCIESYLCGEGLSSTYRAISGKENTSEKIALLATQGDSEADKALDHYCKQLAYGLSQVVNIIDPDVIVLGGGLSNISCIYSRVPQYWQEFIFSDTIDTQLVKAEHGDSSGVYGAAWLWNQ